MAGESVDEMPRVAKAPGLPPIDVAKALRKAHRHIAVHGQDDGIGGEMSDTMLFARTATAEEAAKLAAMERMEPLLKEIAEGNAFTVKVLQTVTRELELVKRGQHNCESSLAASEKTRIAENKQMMSKIVGLERALKDAMGRKL